MDIEQYVSERQKHLDKSKGQIRNFEVFDFNYIPQKPLMREEVKPVIDSLIRYQQTGIANNVLILGSRGCGKSVLAKYLMKVLSQQGQLDFAYANCRQHNTSFKILAPLLGLRPRGCSLDELWQRFTDARKGKTDQRQLFLPFNEDWNYRLGLKAGRLSGFSVCQGDPDGYRQAGKNTDETDQ